ncbi:MAG: hypothetical protein ACT4OP_11080 [Actinomycetota bacterium]
MRVAVALLTVAGCQAGSVGTTLPVVRPDIAPEGAATAALNAMVLGDAAGLTALTVIEQMPWLAMAEGASIEQAAALLQSGSDEVAVHYWEGFLGATEISEATIGAVETREVGSHQFARVGLSEGDARSLVLRLDTEWRIDVIASFGATLAERLFEAVGLVSANQGDPAERMRELILAQRDSTEVAAADPALGSRAREAMNGLAAAVAGLDR